MGEQVVDPIDEVARLEGLREKIAGAGFKVLENLTVRRTRDEEHQ